jgi:cobalt transporter subunit CbtA
MIGRVILAALLAGIAAGLCIGVLQQVRLTPLILEAETFESGHSHGSEASPVEEVAVSWRTPRTYAASAVTGAGFAAILCGVSFLSSVPITRRNGFVWGMAGFAVFALAPAAGLPPELPGVPAADLGARQLWWISTVVFSAAGLWLISQRRELWAIAVGVLLILLPQIIGAPQPPSHETVVPATLLARFVADSLAVNGLFWLLIGTFLGVALSHEKLQEI